MSKEVAVVEITAQKISKATGYSTEQVAIVKNTVAKGTSNTELAFFLNFAKSVNLNPFNKEVWCYKDKRGNLLVFAGRDGFLKKAQQSEQWDGMMSCEVCENDTFNRRSIVNTETGKYITILEHETAYKNRGKIIGAYAVVKPKDVSIATVEWADFNTYNKGQFTWSTHPADMIRKVAETHALKKAFGISGLQSEYDFDVNNGIAIPIQTEQNKMSDEDRLIFDKLDKKKEFIQNGKSKDGFESDEQRNFFADWQAAEQDARNQKFKELLKQNPGYKVSDTIKSQEPVSNANYPEMPVQAQVEVLWDLVSKKK